MGDSFSMARIVLILLVIALCVSEVYTHATKYPHRQELVEKARENADHPTRPGQNTTGMPHPGILSWHVHITYTLFHEPVVARAMALRDKTRHAFAEYLGPDCPGRYEYEDHSIWAQWAGEPWPLDMTIFEYETQTNEFGQYRGDADNPVCLDEGAVCGDSSVFGPANLCCFNLSC